MTALSSLHSLFFSPLLKIPSPKLKPSPFFTPPTTGNVISPIKAHKLRKRTEPKLTKCHAVTDMSSSAVPTPDDHKVLVGPASEEESRGERRVADYDWTEEWYPLYLTKDVPDDAPLGLTVFDQQIVLYKDGKGELRCHQDRCPHRLAKLSEGQLIDGRLECLYHGWQFEGEGKCVKIPQLPADAKIPRSACVRTYEVKESQGVVWVWMSQKTPPNPDKLPWFENFARPGFQDVSTIHELPYDHSILLENLMDPAHIPISHDRTDYSAKREDAQPLGFEVTERTDRGFAGQWGREKDGSMPNFLRFKHHAFSKTTENQLTIRREKNTTPRVYSSADQPDKGNQCLLCGLEQLEHLPWIKLFPDWYFHQSASKVFEQDMGFLSSQNEVLLKEKVPTKELYFNLRSIDTWVAEYRKWMDKAGHGMPYYFGHSTISLPKVPAVVEHAPAGLVAGVSASLPAKGGIGTMHAPNLANRYFRHVIHCKGCRSAVKAFNTWKNSLSTAAALLTALAILGAGRQWRAFCLVSASLCLAGVYACSTAISMNTTNFIRTHRRL